MYRARDTKLEREVAIKVLPDEFANDEERLARFEREAKLLASLNHPNIASIHGFEDSDGVKALALELVEGPTLAERIAEGPIPVEETIAVAKQIAEALEAGHESGVIHRDLKPANIKLREDGTVKVLDYGLAKALEGEASDVPDSELSQSPTLTRQGTQIGVILGTAAYMSPEQAQGKLVDPRTDVWAFGAVIYEMLVGRRAFGGEGVSDTLAAVLRAEPDFDALPTDAPPALRRVLKLCLTKQLKDRFRAIGDVRLVLDVLRDWDGASDEMAPARHQEDRTGISWRERLLLALCLVLSLLFLWNLVVPTVRSTVTPTSLEVALPPDQELTGLLDVSPDGTRIAYTTTDGRLHLRSLDSFTPRIVGGTEGAFAPFFSPSGDWVGFFAKGKLWRVAYENGEPLEIADAPTPLGGTWGMDDSIVFVPSLSAGLARVDAGGGAVVSLTTPDNLDGGYGHAWPQWLPDGEHVLFSIWGNEQVQRVATLSMQSGNQHTVLRSASGARYVETGHLLYSPLRRDSERLTDQSAAGSQAIRFDVARLQVLGTPFPLSELHWEPGFSRSPFAVSSTGTLIYNPGNPASRTLVWVDREGTATPVAPTQREYDNPRLSPDGALVAVKERWDLSLWDLRRGTRTRLTSKGNNFTGGWRPDGERFFFSSNREGNWNIYSAAVLKSDEPERVAPSTSTRFIDSVSARGTLAITEANPSTGLDIWTVPTRGNPEPFRVSSFNECNARFSPDGRLLAYESDESGRNEIYVESYPTTGERRLVSNNGGVEPLWSPDGSELFYRNEDVLLAVTISPTTDKPGVPKPLFVGNYRTAVCGTEYDVSKDGTRFLMTRREPASIPTRLHVVLNWTEELKRPVPTEN